MVTLYMYSVCVVRWKNGCSGGETEQIPRAAAVVMAVVPNFQIKVTQGDPVVRAVNCRTIGVMTYFRNCIISSTAATKTKTITIILPSQQRSCRNSVWRPDGKNNYHLKSPVFIYVSMI